MIWFTIIGIALFASQTSCANLDRAMPIRTSKLNSELPATSEFPYFVSLRKVVEVSNGSRVLQHFCSGTLLSNRWVMTAAHCTDSIKVDSSVILFVGLTPSGEAENSYYTDKIIRHPKYNKDSMEADIALVQSRAAIKMHTFVQPVSLAKEWIGEDITASFPSWIPLKEKGDLKESLGLTSTKTISNAECEKRCGGKHEVIIHETTLCTLESVNSQRSDSGIPLVSDDQLIAIASMNPLTAKADDPIYFTRISTYLDWIQYTTDIIVKN